MRLALKLGNADKIEATATITMTIGEWKDLRDQLGTHWPASNLSDAISSAVSAAEKVFWGEHDDG